LRHTWQRTRLSTEQRRMKTEILMQHKARLNDAINSLLTSSNLMLRAHSIEQTKLSYATIGWKESRELNILQLVERRNKVRTMADTFTDFQVEQAQHELEMSNLEEKLKHWKSKIELNEATRVNLKKIKSERRYFPSRSELEHAKSLYNRVLSAFQVTTIDECIQKFDNIASANESLRSYINHLLLQLAEERNSKKSLKSELRESHHFAHQPSLPSALTPSDGAENEGEMQDLLTNRLRVFDSVSLVKSILSRIDRVDENRELGPHLPELDYGKEAEMGSEHCMAVLLVIERKLWQCQEAYVNFTRKQSPSKSTRSGKTKTLSALFSPHDVPRRSLFQTIDLKFTATSVNSIRSKLYSSHFVEDPEPSSALLTGKSKGKITNFLSDVAKVHFEMASNLRQAKLPEMRKSPGLTKEKDEEDEVAFLASEVKRMKKDASLLPAKSSIHKHSYSLSDYKSMQSRAIGLQKHRSELDLALGIPQISKHIQELNHMAMVYQKTQSGSDAGLKELYQEHCRKK